MSRRRRRRAERNRTDQSAVVIDHDPHAHPHSGCAGVVIVATAVIVTGAYFLLGNFGVWDRIPLRWAHIWPFIPIALGAWLIFRLRAPNKVAIAIIAVGVFFFLNALGVIPGGIWGYIWPIALIAVGVALLAPFVIRRWLRR